MELAALQEVNQAVQSAGAAIVAVSPQLEKYSKQVVKKNGLEFPVLQDQGNGLAKHCGLVFDLPDDLKTLYTGFGIDLERFNGNEHWQLPMPARYIIDRTGKIIDAHVSVDYKERPEPSSILKALESC